MAAAGEGEAFGDRLRRLRQSRSLTQEELAERAGVTVKAVGALERGERRRPFPHTVRSLAEALELDEGERLALVASVPARAARAVVGQPDAGEQGPVPGGVVSPATPTIGRDRQADQLVEMLTVGAVRLATLTGIGGVGKTRLAQEVLRRAAPSFPDGSAFVDLSAVREPALVIGRVAAAIGVQEAPGGISATGLAAHLTGRRLIVLDNLEQVLACAPAVAELVAAAPELVLVVTSRAPLRVRAEREVPVPPLGLPGDDSVAAVAASPATVMFLDRAAAAGAPLEVSADNTAVLAAVVRRLEGIPLALELAAARARLLPPSALLARLEEHGLEPGLGAPRDLPDRQRTLGAVLDWSVDLLTPPVRAELARAGVFSGGFSLGSAAAVGEASEEETLARLSVLVEQSLVSTADPPDDGPRFRLLEPVRHYALIRLREVGLAASTADAHAAHFHRAALGARDQLHGPGLRPVLDRLEADHANLRSAFLRLIELDRPGDAAELAGSIWLHLALRGHTREGLAWLDRVRGPMSEAAVCRAAVARLGLLLVIGDVGGMRREADLVVPVLSRVALPSLAAEAAILIGQAAVFARDVPAAVDHLDRALTLAGEDPWVVAHASIGRGQLSLVEGDAPGAVTSLVAAVDSARATGNDFTVATALNSVASAHEVVGDEAAAASALGEALELSWRSRLGWTLAYAMPALAGVAARTGDPLAAATLYGAAARLAASDAVNPHFPPARSTADAGVLTARAALGEAAFRAAWDVGRAATVPEVAQVAAAVVAEVTGRGPA